ncbi:OPT/YSL family transporter, partial [uncultured Clostridium sp.]|uniref:OPT/YSL family transporter n=1 Tax=uncultured Clostridium sp. TaxID=59620 RepID=UPI002632DA1A
FAGSILSNFGIMPLIGYFVSLGRNGATVWNDPGVAINAMQVKNIAGSYVKYIGAGMMLSGGFIGAIKLIPTIVASIKETMNAKSSNGTGSSSIGNVILLSGIVITFIGGFVISGGNILMAITAAALSLFLSLLFAIVSGRLTGTIGTSNLPVSGMTIASIVIVTLLFVVMGWKSPANNKSLLLFGTFIVTVISVAAGYCQSQKVTFIVGGDKNEMQKYFAIAGIAGVVVVIGTILLLSTKLSMTGDNVQFALPQANLMATLTAGIMSGKLPWVMVITGIVMGIVLYILKLPVMTIAIGFYLPIATNSIILIGALVRLFIEKTSKSKEDKELKIANGIGLSSGLVAGGSILGLVGIILQVTGVLKGAGPTGFSASNGMAFIILVVLIIATIIPIMKSKVKHAKQ